MDAQINRDVLEKVVSGLYEKEKHMSWGFLNPDDKNLRINAFKSLLSQMKDAGYAPVPRDGADVSQKETQQASKLLCARLYGNETGNVAGYEDIAPSLRIGFAAKAASIAGALEAAGYVFVPHRDLDLKMMARLERNHASVLREGKGDVMETVRYGAATCCPRQEMNAFLASRNIGQLTREQYADIQMDELRKSFSAVYEREHAEVEKKMNAGSAVGAVIDGKKIEIPATGDKERDVLSALMISVVQARRTSAPVLDDPSSSTRWRLLRNVADEKDVDESQLLIDIEKDWLERKCLSRLGYDPRTQWKLALDTVRTANADVLSAEKSLEEYESMGGLRRIFATKPSADVDELKEDASLAAVSCCDEITRHFGLIRRYVGEQEYAECRCVPDKKTGMPVLQVNCSDGRTLYRETVRLKEYGEAEPIAMSYPESENGVDGRWEEGAARHPAVADTYAEFDRALSQVRHALSLPVPVEGRKEDGLLEDMLSSKPAAYAPFEYTSSRTSHEEFVSLIEERLKEAENGVTSEQRERSTLMAVYSLALHGGLTGHERWETEHELETRNVNVSEGVTRTALERGYADAEDVRLGQSPKGFVIPEISYVADTAIGVPSIDIRGLDMNKYTEAQQETIKSNVIPTLRGFGFPENAIRSLINHNSVTFEGAVNEREIRCYETNLRCAQVDINVVLKFNGGAITVSDPVSGKALGALERFMKTRNVNVDLSRKADEQILEAGREVSRKAAMGI